METVEIPQLGIGILQYIDNVVDVPVVLQNWVHPYLRQSTAAFGRISVSTSSQLAQFSPGNLDILRRALCMAVVMGFSTHLAAFFQTPLVGVESWTF